MAKPSELYTSLSRLKASMNGGEVPVMTPLGARAQRYIDPALTPGLGALEEDASRGLRCPVRGCGGYYHRLSIHLNKVHKNIGGAKEVRAALQLPTTARLVSSADRAANAGKCGKHMPAGVRPQHLNRGLTPDGVQKRLATMERNRLSMGGRNLRDSCEAQIKHKLIDLQHKVGRTPSWQEAEAEYGSYFPKELVRLYGSWHAALAQCGLEACRNRGWRNPIPREDMLAVLRLWFDTYGDLPTIKDAENRDAIPLLPVPRTIVRAFDAEGWGQAMYRASMALGISSARYGFDGRLRKASA